MKTVSILGSTGSIGLQALDVVRRTPGLRVISIAARSGWEAALRQAAEFGVGVLALADARAASEAQRQKSSLGMEDLEVLSGPEGVEKAATLQDVDVVLHAIPGFAGISPLLSSLEKGKRIAFAGKEALVCAGELVSQYITGNQRFVPVDSEHSAISQCLRGEDPCEVSEIVLTASGGALRDLPEDRIPFVTPDDVLRHPTWQMGRKITVDSATLFNKGLEVIEAHHLFGLPYERIKVVLHRESIVHSMVTFRDGTTKAQASRPDMRLAISYGLTYPERLDRVIPSLAPYRGTLTFEEVDTVRFPSLSLCYRAGEIGGSAPCVLSCADEVLVQEFLAGRIGFSHIPVVLKELLDSYDPKKVDGMEILEEEREWAVRRVREILDGKNWSVQGDDDDCRK